MGYSLFALLFFTLSLLIYNFVHSPNFVRRLCDTDTCPVCYGNNFCKEFDENKVMLQFNSFGDYINNIFGVKNVFFAVCRGAKVVLKKLAHNSELKRLDELKAGVSYKDLKTILVSDSDLKRYKFCDVASAELFLQYLKYEDIQNICSILLVNIEPILLQIFNKQEGWCVPKLYGYCGRLAVIENSGIILSNVEHYNWFDRAYLAFQILQAAYNFTENHKDFRLYLTDISPDNVAVDENLRITFIDLEDVIIKKKTLEGGVHHTEHFNEDVYMYSERAVCESSKSDHNVYAVCRLLLSKTALWPMMKNGLLHTPPKHVLKQYSGLFMNLEACVEPETQMDRFKLGVKILTDLKTILKTFTNRII